MDEKIGNGDDLSKAINLLKWISENIYHNGNYDYPKEQNAINMLNDHYQKGKDFGINCKSLSRTLTGCLLSVGIKARTLFILPASPYDFDNHVITHAYLKETRQWIMLDPTYNAYLMDKDKKILNVFEIRNILANQENIFFNNEMSYNGNKFDKEELTTYYAKDLFYFETSEVSKFNETNDDKYIYIVPKNYDIKKKEITNLKYRIKKGDTQEWIPKQIENLKIRQYKYVTPIKLLEIS